LWSAEFSDESFEVDPDRGWVAVYGHGAVVRVLDLDDGSELMTLAGHTGAITDVAFDPRRDRLYSTALDGETLVWDVAPTGPSGTRVIPIGSAEPYAMVVSPDGTEVAVMRDDALTRYDLGGGAPLLSVEGSMNWRLPAPVSPDWRLVAMVESGFTPGVGEALPEGWVRDLITGEKLHPLPACVWPKGFSSDGSMLALDGQNLIIDQGVVQCSPRQAPGGIDHRSRVVDPVTGEVLLDLGGRGLAGPTAAVFNPAGVFEPDRYLAILEDYDTVELHDMVTGRQVATVDTGEQPYVMAFDPSGRYLAVGGGNSDVWVVDVKALVEGASVEEAMLMFDEVGSDGIWVALGRDGLLATAAYPHVLMWDIHTGGLIRELAVAPSRQVPSNVAFTPDGDLLYIEGSEDQGYGVHTFITDPDRLVELARTRVTRDLSEDECERYLPENNPVVCP
jgi:WD40 repeat protein